MQNKGCITCKKCEQVRLNFYCGRKKLSQKQLYNKYGFCTRYEPVEQKPQTNEEWFCQLPTGEKAEFFANIYPKSVGEALIKISNGDKDRWLEWLKEKHHAN